MSRQPLPADTILGKDSDQYKIDTVLGPGGFGVTYLARSLRLDREVAIKEYFPAEFAYRDGSTTIRSSGSGASIAATAPTGQSPITGKTFPVVWITKHPKARIVCITLGHDGKAHEHPAYKMILQNSLKWAAWK